MIITYEIMQERKNCVIAKTVSSRITKTGVLLLVGKVATSGYFGGSVCVFVLSWVCQDIPVKTSVSVYERERVCMLMSVSVTLTDTVKYF